MTITPAVGLWMPAGVLHSAIAPAGTWYRAAQLDIASVPSLSDVPVAIEVTPLLRNLLERLADESLGAPSRSLTEQMVIDVLAPSPNELLVLVPDSPLLQPIVDAIGDDPSDMRTLSDWARLLGVSPRTITRVFRSETGMSFGQWGLGCARPTSGDPSCPRLGSTRGCRACGLPLDQRIRGGIPAHYRRYTRDVSG